MSTPSARHLVPQTTRALPQGTPIQLPQQPLANGMASGDFMRTPLIGPRQSDGVSLGPMATQAALSIGKENGTGPLVCSIIPMIMFVY